MLPSSVLESASFAFSISAWYLASSCSIFLRCCSSSLRSSASSRICCLRASCSWRACSFHVIVIFNFYCVNKEIFNFANETRECSNNTFISLSGNLKIFSCDNFLPFQLPDPAFRILNHIRYFLQFSPKGDNR